MPVRSANRTRERCSSSTALTTCDGFGVHSGPVMRDSLAKVTLLHVATRNRRPQWCIRIPRQRA